MADTYQQFKTEFADVKKHVSGAVQDIKTYENTEGHCTGIIKQAAIAIGERVQVLRDSGMAGTKISDFASDQDVKKSLAICDTQLGMLDRDIKTLTAKRVEFQKWKKRLTDLQKDLGTEIADRKKQTQTKLKVGNKSLPDMVKLKKDVDDYLVKDAGWMQIEAIITMAPKLKTFETQRDNQIARELAKTKAQTAAAAQGVKDFEALRLSTRNAMRLNKLYKETLPKFAAANKALAAGDVQGYKQLQKELAEPVEQFRDTWAMYERVLADSWVKDQLKDSADRAKILEAVKGIGGMNLRIKKEAENLAKAQQAAGVQ